MEKLVIKLRQGVSNITSDEIERGVELTGLIGMFAFMLIAMGPLY